MAGKAGGARDKYLTKDELFSTLGTVYEDYELGKGKTIKIRSLGLNEITNAFRKGAEDLATMFKRVCVLGIIEPELTLDDLSLIEKAQGGRVSDISNAILRLSGVQTPTPEEGESMEAAVEREFRDFFKRDRTSSPSMASASSDSDVSPEK